MSLIRNLFLASAWAASPAAFGADAELHVAAAASLQDVLQEIGKAIPDSLLGGAKVTYNFAATSTLARQIEAGAPIDVMVSADEANMDKLEKSDKIDATSRLVVTGNEIVLIVKPSAAHGFVTKPEDLTKTDVKRIALCDESVPIGHYGKELLTKLGLYDKIKTKFVMPENVRAALTTVESDAADAGFVYATDVGKASKARIVYQAGAKEGLTIRYPAAIVKSSKNAAIAAKYVAFLRSETAQTIFAKFGFTAAPAS